MVIVRNRHLDKIKYYVKYLPRELLHSYRSVLNVVITIELGILSSQH